MSWKIIAIALGYFALFCGTAVALLWWQRKQRKIRKPFGDDLRLLRGPGESQFKLVQKQEESLPPRVMLLSMIPSTIGLLLLKFTAIMPGAVQLGGLALTLAGFLVSFYLAAKLLAGWMHEGGNRYLGYFGERIVAEHLEPLKHQGWRILHDVPGSANGHKFNLDHVAVGPQGAFVIETKTRRKGSARPGFKDGTVSFDGQDLIWPWDKDNHGLEQAERSAKWLADTIKSETGEHAHVQPILVLPGWFVEMKPTRNSRFCKVANPKWLAGMLTNGRAILNQSQIDAIAAKLEARCRDVEY